MYCRNCGAPLNDRAEICVKCGCRPLNGTAYCQECGARTTDKQELCIKCGCRLGGAGRQKGVFDAISDGINDGINGGNGRNGEINLDFSYLAPYYQKEFQKIYNSGETYKGKFNVWAFLFGYIWTLTKGCWLSAVVSLAVCFVFALTAGYACYLIGFLYGIILGFRGTYIYYCAYAKDKQYII